MVKVNVDLSGVGTKIKKAKKVGQYALANQMLSDMNDKYTPFLSGELSNAGYIDNDGKSIVFPSIYAKRLYYGITFNFTLTHHPLAGPKWDERAKADKLDVWIQVTQNAIREGI